MESLVTERGYARSEHTYARGARRRIQNRGRGWTSPSGLLRSTAARPLRFAGVGLAAGLVQLSLLALLTRLGWPELLADAVAFALAAQANFALSALFTWRDRRDGRPLRQRWLMFHAAILGMALVNMAVFALARTALPTVLAAATGIAVAAVGNFLVGDRLVFRAPRAPGRRGAGNPERQVAA